MGNRANKKTHSFLSLPCQLQFTPGNPSQLKGAEDITRTDFTETSVTHVCYLDHRMEETFKDPLTSRHSEKTFTQTHQMVVDVFLKGFKEERRRFKTPVKMPSSSKSLQSGGLRSNFQDNSCLSCISFSIPYLQIFLKLPYNDSVCFQCALKMMQ